MKASLKLALFTIGLFGVNGPTLGQSVGNSSINITATVYPQCKLNAATVSGEALNFDQQASLTGSSLIFQNATADFNKAASAAFSYTATSNTSCRYTLESSKDGMSDSYADGNNWRNYRATIQNGASPVSFTTQSGSSPSRSAEVISTLREDNFVNVSVIFDPDPNFTPNARTYSDTLILRVFTN